MTPKLAELFRAAALPLTNVSILLALLMFWLLLALVAAAGMLGVWLAIVIVPALFRYFTNLVETVGRGLKVAPLGAEFFRWVGDWWSLFPAVVVILIAWASYTIHLSAGETATTVFIVITGTIYPAMLAVLSVTHSPMHSINPVAIIDMLRSIGASYAIAPLYLGVIVYISTLLQPLPFMAELAIELLLLFSLHAVIGCLIEPHGIFDDVYIPEPVERSAAEVSGDLEKVRVDALTQAYGLINRGNREGGFKHLFEWIGSDPQVPGAWAWYFSHMLEWENKQHSLFFAQHYVHDMLKHGEHIPALKVILRCRMIDETWKPLSEDLPAAIHLAETHGNIELAAVLKRY